MSPWPLLPLLPADVEDVPRPGRVMRWPGERRDWLWTGSQWIGMVPEFDGGDAWSQLEELDEAA